MNHNELYKMDSEQLNRLEDRLNALQEIIEHNPEQWTSECYTEWDELMILWAESIES